MEKIMYYNFNSRTGNRREQLRPLSNEQILKYAPAVGADQPFSKVSDKYSFIPTINVVNILRDQGWVPVQAKQAKVRIEEKDGFQKHLVRFQKSGLEITTGERLDLLLFNSHDRGCAFNLAASVWRQVCSNGLMVANDLFAFSHRHINFDGNAFLESAQRISNGASEIAAQVENFKVIELTPDEKGVFAKMAHHTVYDDPEKAPIFPDRLLTTRRNEDKVNDLWTTFNVIQENIVKGGLFGRSKTTGKSQKTREIKSLDKDLKVNKLLWMLTTEMAKLKKGKI